MHQPPDQSVHARKTSMVLSGITTAQQPEIILQVQNVTKVYGNTRNALAYKALNGMSFDVYEHEFADRASMGPSGVVRPRCSTCWLDWTPRVAASCGCKART